MVIRDISRYLGVVAIADWSVAFFFAPMITGSNPSPDFKVSNDLLIDLHNV